MPDYAVFIKTSAQKELDGLSGVIFERVLKKIIALAGEPRPAGVKKLKGPDSFWRLRVGDYRVVYEIDDAQRKIEVLRVAHRKDVYGKS